MPTITTKDGTQIYYKDLGSGHPVVFRNAQFRVYKGADHGICSTRKDRVNADLLEFFRGAK